MGGAELLFIRLANELIHRCTHKISIVDYKDGFMAKRIKNTTVKHIKYKTNQQVHIPKNAILIIPANLILTLNDKLILQPETRILMWVLQPYNLLPVLPFGHSWQYSNWFLLKILFKTFLRKEAQTIRKIIKTAHEKKSILFMDGANFEVYSQLLGCRIKSEYYLPIISPTADIGYPNWRTQKASTIRITWLGRIDKSFKFYSLCRVLEDIKKYASNIQQSITVHVIGEGDGLVEIMHTYNELVSFEITYHGTIDPTELDSFLINHTDILFAMGTSALEGAKLGIPTVCIDAAYSRISNNYLYRWLHETRNYSLGYILHEDFPTENTHSFSEIIDQLTKKSKELSFKAYSYYSKNHTTQHIVSRFLDYCKDVRLTYDDTLAFDFYSKSYLKKIWYYIR
ncbi:MAG: hypothetical protein D3924_00980 [Candidatus Electrothrix sp. AR4]|nr:hypothetical protein [Candidatus Electrothrix sp. AR4]